MLDDGRLVVCHAGLPEKYHGRTSGRVRSHALYGETTGETDEFGLPVRYPWAEDYRGRAAVVYGHTPVPSTSWINNTVCLDTGAVFGGKMTALRWPERELVDVPAEQVWYEPVKPLATEAPGGREGRPLDLDDVQGRRTVETRHMGRLAVREENAAAALEVMSRFAVDPRLLPYLPPTMAPTATSREEGYLEHPAEAFGEYRAAGTEAYRRYCWSTEGLDGVRVAPFQILAVQGRSLASVPHDEQLAWLDRLVEHDLSGLLQVTRRLVVDTADEASVGAGVDWWLEMTGRGGEGMVVKPLGALVRDGKGRLVQPGIKVRGREYLRIIYGPEYTRPDNLDRLRGRFLGHKRSLALREYALGLEALDRLADGEPLWRVHEAVFAVLALESEPVDPRL